MIASRVEAANIRLVRGAYSKFDCLRTEPSPRKLSARDGREDGAESSGCINGDSTSVDDLVFCGGKGSSLSFQMTREHPAIATVKRRSSCCLPSWGLFFFDRLSSFLCPERFTSEVLRWIVSTARCTTLPESRLSSSVGAREWSVLDDVSTAVPGTGFCSGGLWGADIVLRRGRVQLVEEHGCQQTAVDVNMGFPTARVVMQDTVVFELYGYTHGPPTGPQEIAT